MQTLNYFLSDNGIDKFKAWYTSKPTLKSIYTPLEEYINKLLIPTLEQKEHIKIINTINELLDLYIKHTYNQTAIEIFNEWLDDINKYCFQGGYGYSFMYPNAPHHWVIKPEFYEQVSKIPEKVLIAACFANQYIIISNKANWEIWSS